MFESKAPWTNPFLKLAKEVPLKNPVGCKVLTKYLPLTSQEKATSQTAFPGLSPAHSEAAAVHLARTGQ